MKGQKKRFVCSLRNQFKRATDGRMLSDGELKAMYSLLRKRDGLKGSRCVEGDGVKGMVGIRAGL